jgi:hypothetical protein
MRWELLGVMVVVFVLSIYLLRGASAAEQRAQE